MIIYQLINYQIPEVNKITAVNPIQAAKKFYTAIYQSIYSVPKKIVFQDSQLNQYEFRGHLKKHNLVGGADAESKYSPFYNFNYEEYLNYQSPTKPKEDKKN